MINTTSSLLEGKPVPEFSLLQEEGQRVSLEMFRGRWVLIYFYPKDFTPGCTLQACELRDFLKDLPSSLAPRLQVLGISKDSVSRHRKFRDSFELPFPLLSDPTGEVAKAFGAWGTKKMFGISTEGVLRSSFLIDPEGKLYQKEVPTSAKGHAEKFLGAFQKAAAG